MADKQPKQGPGLINRVRSRTPILNRIGSRQAAGQNGGPINLQGNNQAAALMEIERRFNLVEQQIIKLLQTVAPRLRNEHDIIYREIRQIEQEIIRDSNLYKHLGTLKLLVGQEVQAASKYYEDLKNKMLEIRKYAEVKKQIARAKQIPDETMKELQGMEQQVTAFVDRAKNLQKDADSALVIVQAQISELEGWRTDLRKEEAKVREEITELAKAGNILSIGNQEHPIIGLNKEKLEKLRDEIRRVYELFQGQQATVDRIKAHKQAFINTLSEINRRMGLINHDLETVKTDQRMMDARYQKFRQDLPKIKGA